MKKLNTALLAGILLVSGLTNAAIIHTDNADETLGSGGTINIDMNNDATDDFSIYDGSFGGPQEPSIAFNADAGFVMVGSFGAGEWDVISGLTMNTVIDANANFANNGVDGYIDPFWGTTMFPTDMDYYLGATFKIGADTHYGWIKVNWDGNGTFIVKEFAYEDQADVAILAGATPSAGNIDVTTIDLTSAGSATSVDVNSDLQISATIAPNDATNQDVTWSIVAGTGTASIDQNGLMTGLTVGTVTVKAIADDGSGIEGTIDIDVTEAVASINENAQIISSIYPNPVINNFSIESNEVGTGQLFSQNGQLMLSFSLNQTIQQINISDFPAGIYVLSVVTEKGQTTKKLIKK